MTPRRLRAGSARSLTESSQTLPSRGQCYGCPDTKVRLLGTPSDGIQRCSRKEVSAETRIALLVSILASGQNDLRNEDSFSPCTSA